MTRQYGQSIVQDTQFWVRNYEEPVEEIAPPIRVRAAGSPRISRYQPQHCTSGDTVHTYRSHI